MKLFVFTAMSLLPLAIVTIVLARLYHGAKACRLERQARWKAFEFWRRKCLESLALMDQAQRHAELTGDYEPFKLAEQAMNTNLRRYEKDVLGLS